MGQEMGPLPVLQHAERRAALLAPSSLDCIRHAPTINMTVGCGCRCTYCYARAFPEYAGDDYVAVYENLAPKLAAELARKRIKPKRVYFSPSTDCFGPYRELQEATCEVMRVLLEAGVGVSFLTKGHILPFVYELFRAHASLVHAQIDISTVDAKLSRILEPRAASPSRRLANIERLLAVGVQTEARIDPMVPYLTDTPGRLTALCRELAARGVRRVAAAYLHLRSGIRQQLARELPGPVLRERVLGAFDHGVRMELRMSGSAVVALPPAYRRRGYERLKSIASRFGLQVAICACKNTDLDIDDRCNITGEEAQPQSEQLLLFT